MAGTKRRNRDLTGIRQRGGTYQVRIFGGADPVTGKQVILTGSADSEDAAVKLRDTLRQQVRDRTAARTNATLGHLLDEWLSSHQVEETTRGSYSLLIENFIRPAFGDTTLFRGGQSSPSGATRMSWRAVMPIGYPHLTQAGRWRPYELLPGGRRQPAGQGPRGPDALDALP